MEIKRFGDKFIIELCNKKFELYWSRKFRFGENFIRRFCERIKENELEKLVEVINLTNRLVDTKEKPTEEEAAKIHAGIGIMSRIVFFQTFAYFKHLPVDGLKEFIDACYPLTYKTAQRQLEKFYSERYKGTECELERKLNDASCIEDWLITRQMISKFVANDITELLRFAILQKGQNIIHEVLGNKMKSQLDFNSFFIQLFKVEPYFSDLERRNMDKELQKDYIVKISNIYNEICGFEKLEGTAFQGLISDEFIGKVNNYTTSANTMTEEAINDIEIQICDVLDTIWLSARQHINLLSTEKEINRMGDLVRLSEAMYRALPRRRLTDTSKTYSKSNEERRNTVLGFFAYWDANMPDDLAIIKEENELKEKIAKQKQENIDKDDIEHVGKTQAEINAEREANGGLTMELKDENGKVMTESNLM